MKKFLYIIGILATFASCNDLDDNERFTYVEPARPTQPDQPGLAERYILLEDYTGQLCPNCPKAVPVIDQLHELYGDNVIAVGIHGGRCLDNVVSGVEIELGFATSESKAYYEAAGSPAQPSGRINRKGTPATIDKWRTLADAEFSTMATFSLEITTNYEAPGRTATVNVEAKGLSGSNTGKLQLWIVEDNIVAPQSQPDGSMTVEYIHNHVFRASVNGTWGEDFAIAENETKTYTATATLKSYWKPENISIVAFVYNDSGVLQAAKAKLQTTPQQSEEETNKE